MRYADIITLHCTNFIIASTNELNWIFIGNILMAYRGELKYQLLMHLLVDNNNRYFNWPRYALRSVIKIPVLLNVIYVNRYMI